MTNENNRVRIASESRTKRTKEKISVEILVKKLINKSFQASEKLVQIVYENARSRYSEDLEHHWNESLPWMELTDEKLAVYRQELGNRIEMILSTFALEAISDGKKRILIASSERFTSRISDVLLDRFNLNASFAMPFVEELKHNLIAFCADHFIEGDWGKLILENNELWMILNEKSVLPISTTHEKNLFEIL